MIELKKALEKPAADKKVKWTTLTNEKENVTCVERNNRTM